jgi:hypothetical protein
MATAVSTELPESVSVVMDPATARVVVLVSSSEAEAGPDAVDWPVQYQADDSAFGALTSAPGIGWAPTGALLRVAAKTATAAITTSTAARIGQRRSGV